MANPFLGEIQILACNFPPQGWAFCNGQILAITQNTALFAILGTTYGGDGVQTFALPNLQGSVPMFYEQGPGLSNHVLGETGGSQTVTLLSSELPAHGHTLNAVALANGTAAPAGAALAEPYKQVGPVKKALNQYASGSPNVTLAPAAVGNAGGNQPHNNLQPYLALNFCIALQGIFPSRS
jgi:microcystin-dependent protein